MADVDTLEEAAAGPGAPLRHMTLTRPKKPASKPPTRRHMTVSEPSSPSPPETAADRSRKRKSLLPWRKSPKKSKDPGAGATPSGAAAAAAAAAAPPPNDMAVPGEDGGGAAADGPRRIGHRKIDKHTGEVAYKKVRTSELQDSIQLGIRIAVGSVVRRPPRDLLFTDFQEVESFYFPK